MLTTHGQEANTGAEGNLPQEPGAAPEQAAPQQPGKRGIDPFTKKLTGSKFLLPGAEPRLSFEIKNVSATPVEFTRRPDGSAAYWRFRQVALRVKDSAGNFIPMKVMGVCNTKDPAVRQPGEEALRPGEKKTLPIFWRFQQRLDKPGQYSFVLMYTLADDAPVETAVLSVKVVPVTERMVEKAIAHLWWPYQDEPPAFVHEALDQDRWQATDIRNSNGYVSAVVRFAKGYSLPPRPEYANPEF